MIGSSSNFLLLDFKCELEYAVFPFPEKPPSTKSLRAVLIWRFRCGPELCVDSVSRRRACGLLRLWPPWRTLFLSLFGIVRCLCAAVWEKTEIAPTKRRPLGDIAQNFRNRFSCIDAPEFYLSVDGILNPAVFKIKSLWMRKIRGKLRLGEKVRRVTEFRSLRVSSVSGVAEQECSVQSFAS